MRLPEWEKFLDETVKYVKFPFDRSGIRQELSEHMEDLFEDLVAEGVSVSEAKHLAVEYMGNAEEIGKELNKEHKPFWGWLWLITRVAAVLMAIVVAFEGISFGYSAFSFFFSENEYVSDANLVYEMGDIDTSVKLDHTTITITKLQYYDDGEMVVYYRVFNNPFANAVDWSFGLGTGMFTDEDGNRYYSGGGGSQGNVLGSVGNVKLRDFPADAEMLILDYDLRGRQLYAEFPLEKPIDEIPTGEVTQ